MEGLAWRILALASFSLAALLAWSACEASLLSLRLPSGWIAAAMIGAISLSWWFGALQGAQLHRRLRFQVHAGVVVIALFAVHVELRVPNGWLEIALTALLVSSLVSTLVGERLTRASDVSPPADPRVVQRWLLVHVPLNTCLLSLSLFHGAFVHTHGVLAYHFH